MKSTWHQQMAAIFVRDPRGRAVLCSSPVWNGDDLTSSFLTGLNYLYPLTLTGPSPAFYQATSCQNSSSSQDIDGLSRMLEPWNFIRIPSSLVTDITVAVHFQPKLYFQPQWPPSPPQHSISPWLNSSGDVRFLDSKGQGRGWGWSQGWFQGA